MAVALVSGMSLDAVGVLNNTVRGRLCRPRLSTLIVVDLSVFLCYTLIDQFANGGSQF